MIELKGIIDSDESAIFTSFIVDRIREEAVARGGSGGKLRHVTVIEEAQQILGAGASSAPSGSGFSDPRAAAVESFADAVATLRSLGEGIIMSTQRPSELHPRAIANTANRIVLHLEEATDRNAVIEAFDADDRIATIASRLHRGEALARWPGRDDPEVITIVPDPDIDTGRQTTDDEVSAHMTASRIAARQMLPYQLCTLAVCSTGCEPQRRQKGSRLAAISTKDVAQAWDNAAQGQRDPATAIAQALSDKAGTADPTTVYCAAAHLGVQDVIKVDPHNDVRERIADAIAKVSAI